MGRVEELQAKVLCGLMLEEEERPWLRGSYQSYLFCYLDWLSPKVQSEVQQERKKNLGICVQEGIEALTSWQSSAQQ